MTPSAHPRFIRARRWLGLVALALVLGATQPACMGKFVLTEKLFGWNKSVSPSKGTQSLVMMVLILIPVYELAFIGDWVIFNTIEFWTGSNPVAQADPNAIEVIDADTVRIAGADGAVWTLKRLDAATMAVLRDDQPAGVVRMLPDGSVRLEGTGPTPLTLTRDQLAAMVQPAPAPAHP